MSKEKNKIVPKLRFPAFKDLGGWEEKQLGEIGEFIGGGTPDTTIIEYWNGSIQWFTPTEIKEKNVYNSIRTITEKGLQNSSAKLLPKGTLLITTRATIGDVAIANNECTTNQGFQSLLVNDDQINTFWYYWIIQHKSELTRKASGSTFPEIGKNEIIKIKIFHPQKKEQEKISDCLSSLDDLIMAQSQKLEILKIHKKGLMQALFPVESEMMPKRRFEEFKNSGEWKEKTLGSICSNIASGKDKIVENSEYDLYGSTGVIGKTNSCSYDGAFILVARVGANAGLLTRVNEKFGVTDNTLVIFLYNSENLDFVYYTLERLGLNKLVFGSGQPLITGGQLKNLSFTFPEPVEQQKIADCLSSLDELIKAQKEKIETLKSHKKGLMQQLFLNSNNINNG